MPNTLKKHIENYLVLRKKSGLFRELTPCATKSNSKHLYLNLNDYLQLSQHPTVIHAAQKALEIWGTSASGSPIVSSYLPIHQELENTLTKWCGFAHGLLWNSGYSANKALLSALPQRGDVILTDRFVHNSMLLGAQETQAKLIRYQHLNLDHLEELLRIHTLPTRTVFVVTESVFSMEGDYSDLVQMSLLKERYNFFWIVDEAHAMGWYGPKGNGLVAKFNVGKNVDVLVATLGKALASQGAFTLFHDAELRDYLSNSTPEFIYSTYLTPAATAASLAAINLIEADCFSRQSQWLSQTLAFKKKLVNFFPDLPLFDSPIVPLIIGDIRKTLQLANQLAVQEQIFVGAVRPPSVPQGTSRLRLSLHCNLNFSHLGKRLENFFSKFDL